MIITGGSRGIGAATAVLAARRGYAVGFAYRSDAAAAASVLQKVEAAGVPGVAVRCDVSDESALGRFFEEIHDELGPPAVLINNAGITGAASRLDEAEPDTIRSVLDVNLLATILACRLALRRMSSKYGGAGGSIVNVSSGAATLGSPGEFVWYAASKAGVDTLTLGLAKEVARENVRVNAVALGLVDTDMHEDTGIPNRWERVLSTVPMGRGAAPEEAARAILWLASEEASYVTGAILRVAGGR